MAKKALYVWFLAFWAVFIIDQNIKSLFVEGFRFYSECIDLILTFNRGVAFSMFAFLAEYLKYLQILLILGVAIYVIKSRAYAYALPVGIFMGAGVYNIYDRFIHGGVVDYVFWHCGFEFAVFNFADVMIDVAVAWILLQSYVEHKKQKKSTTND